MKRLLVYNQDKNEKLIKERGVSFDQVIELIAQGKFFDIVKNRKEYSHQEIYIIEINNYVYAVPFVDTEKERYLITIIPSRKLTKQYLGGEHEK
jgi:uncharacterized DUF497 family protein